jgi:hypothetical protein
MVRKNTRTSATAALQKRAKAASSGAACETAAQTVSAKKCAPTKKDLVAEIAALKGEQ